MFIERVRLRDANLPLDPDALSLDVVDDKSHTIPELLLAVCIGGTIGTFVRYEVMGIFPVSLFPFSTLCINLVGAFGLGLLLEALHSNQKDTGILRFVRITVGTGCIGAFTTYSSLVLEIDTLLLAHHMYMAFLYASASVIFGVVCTLLGMYIANALQKRVTSQTS